LPQNSRNHRAAGGQRPSPNEIRPFFQKVTTADASTSRFDPRAGGIGVTIAAPWLRAARRSAEPPLCGSALPSLAV